MYTAEQVIKSVLQRILVQGSESDIEASEYSDAIRDMNNFMFALEANGTSLGYTEVVSIGDEITIPNGAIRGLIANLAVEVAPDYDRPISSALANAANDGLKTMIRLGRKKFTSSYPSNLPMGSGSQCITRDDAFYDDAETVLVQSILASNSEATPISAINTPVKVVGDWTAKETQSFVTTNDGKIVFIGSDAKYTGVTATLGIKTSDGSSVTGSAYIAINGVVNASSKITFSLSGDKSIGLAEVLSQSLSKNDYIELFVENQTDTTNIIVTNAKLKVLV